MSKKIQPSEPANHIAVFQETAIRRAWHAEEWWFSVIDVVGVLAETAIPKRYWSDLKRKLAQEAGSGQPYEKIVRLKLTAPESRYSKHAATHPRKLLQDFRWHRAGRALRNV